MAFDSGDLEMLLFGEGETRVPGKTPGATARTKNKRNPHDGESGNQTWAIWPKLFKERITLSRRYPCENFSEISARSRRDENLGGQKRAEITGEMKISAAKNAPRLLARSRRDENLGGQKRAEITGEMKISAAKNAPRLLARSRREKNLGGQKRAEISSEIAPR